MGRLFEMLVYGVVAAGLVCGALLWLALYTESTAPALQAREEAVTPSPAAGTVLHPRSTTNFNSSSMPPPNVVRTARKDYYLPPVSQAQFDSDTYSDMRRDCYAAAANNRDGEYPALQQAACDRFAEFARQKGWDTGPLPQYATPSPPPQEVVYHAAAAPDNSDLCQALLDDEHRIEAEMRKGYPESMSNWYYARLREVGDRLRQLRCPRLD